MMNFSINDLVVIEKQIGKKPKNIYNIPVRCSRNYPVVVTNVPAVVNKEKTYITGNLFWLTCPMLHRSIHDLESKLWISKIKKFIQNDQGLRKRIKQATFHYQILRRSVFRDFFSDSVIINSEDFSRFYQIGIGGIRDYLQVKCLHQHYAHFLVSRNNPIGQIVDKLLNQSICNQSCIQ